MVATVGINVILALGVWILLGLLILKIQVKGYEKEITRLEKELDELSKYKLAEHIKTAKNYQLYIGVLNDKIKKLEGEK